MPCCEINDCAQMSKTIIAARHFGLGGRESLETAVVHLLTIFSINFFDLHETLKVISARKGVVVT